MQLSATPRAVAPERCGVSRHDTFRCSPAAARRVRDVSVAVGWDPENVLAPPQENHIARREYAKKLKANEAFLAAEERRLAKVTAAAEAARAAREPPANNPVRLVEYLLDTRPEEMDFELVRCRPHLARFSPLCATFRSHFSPRRLHFLCTCAAQ